MTKARIVASLLFVASIIAANFLTASFGLVPIGFGLLVTAGTFAAGFAFIARDWVQIVSGKTWVLLLILLGAIVSAVTANPQLALASGLAFLVSELIDFAVFTPLMKRSLSLAVIASSIISAPIDTVLFLYLAGFDVTWSAIVGQFIVKTLIALAAAMLIRSRSSYI